MAVRFSKAMRNFLNAGGSLRQALNGGKIKMFEGAQPASADDAEVGPLLVTYTKSGSAHTAEVRATSTSALTGGASGSITGLKVAGVMIQDGTTTFNTSLTQTAADLARDLNRSPFNLDYFATSTTTSLILTAKQGLGANINTAVSTATPATITMTHGTFAGGTSAANGLGWEVSTAGTSVKRTDETWQGTAVADGTAGWLRRIAAVADPGTSDAAELYLRMDESVASSGAQMNGSTNIINGSVQTITADQLVCPAS